MRGGWSQRGTVLRKISHNHFSFIKGIYLGFDDLAMYERYIEYPGAKKVDPRTITSIQKWITAELIRLAGRHNRQTGIRLLKYAPEKIQTSVAMRESLEEFEQRMGYEGFYTQAELLELFEAHYAHDPQIRKSAKQARIRQRQLDLIAYLVAQESVKPGPKDLIAGWLEPSLTRHFEAAGIATIGQLVDGINKLGANWHRKVPGIGVKAANHIVKWLTDEEVAQSLGVSIHTSALLPPSLLRHEPVDRPQETAIVPFEHFLLPSALDGSQGENRHPNPKTRASNDKEAIELWLKSVRQGHTARAYRKEAERFLLWAILEKKKPFSSLLLDDCLEYRNFLYNIGWQTPALWHQQFALPQDAWLASRSHPRRSPLWRPFEGKLSDLSQKYALGVLSTLCEFLTKIKYLDSNPFVGLTLITDAQHKINAENTLIKADMALIREYLTPRLKEAKYRRANLILLLAYSTGLRLSELTSLRRSNFNRFIRLDDSVERWQITVLGKGNKEREIPLSPALIEHLEEYFYLNGLGGFLEQKGEMPVIASLSNPNQPLGHDRIYMVLKGFFKEVADSLPSKNKEQAERLKQASTHWMRHTFTVNLLESGASLEVARDLLGHASLATTSIYVKTERDRRSRQMDEFIEKAGF